MYVLYCTTVSVGALKHCRTEFFFFLILNAYSHIGPSAESRYGSNRSRFITKEFRIKNWSHYYRVTNLIYGTNNTRHFV